MKAIKLNGKTYKVIEERGDFVYYINEKSKVKSILASQVEFVDTSEVEKKEVKAKVKKLNPANFMSDAEFAKSKYATMSKADFEEERRLDAMRTISW
ncbi:MAG: hypothetical protein PHS05_09375 [Bacteroidales bacterium]|nr:hypothetical protein [Bacteroidales bacterium]